MAAVGYSTARMKRAHTLLPKNCAFNKTACSTDSLQKLITLRFVNLSCMAANTQR